MAGKNNHNGENWPYHLYEGSKPELQGSYVPCATNPCSEHGGSEVYATSPLGVGITAVIAVSLVIVMRLALSIS